MVDAPGASPVDIARRYLGAPYRWGMTERGIDCSGLVRMSYRRTGRVIPCDVDQQMLLAEVIDELQVGDLIVYGDPADHIAVWTGDGQILHSTGRDQGIGVVEETEPSDLRARRHRLVRL